MNRHLGILDISNLIHRFINGYTHNRLLEFEYDMAIIENRLDANKVDIENMKPTLITQLGYEKGMQVLDNIHMKAINKTYNQAIAYIIFTMENHIQRIIRTLDLSHIIIAWDEINNTNFRKLYSKEYKANRSPKTDFFLDVKQRIYDRLSKRYYFLGKDVCEADDIIFTCVEDLKDTFDKITIISSDKDLLCLQMNNKVDIYRYVKGDYILVDDREIVKEQIGVYPEKIPLLLALKGDSADNIKGVVGIGDKKAIQILDYYDDLNSLRTDIELDRLNENLTDLIKRKLKNGLRDLIISYSLVDLKNVKFTTELLDTDKYQIL